MKTLSNETSLRSKLAIAALCAVATTATARDNKVTFGGFASAGYIGSSDYNYLVDSEDGDFDFAELALNATASPLARTRVSAQIFAFELGSYGNFDPILDYAFVDYNFQQAFGLRAGRIKKPQGIYTEIQDIDVARASILLPIGMYDQRYRDFSASVDGISAYGDFALGQNNSIEYNAYAGRVHLDRDGGIGGYAKTLLTESLDNADIDSIRGDLNTGMQLWWRPALSGTRVGVSYSYYNDIELQSRGNFPSAYPVPFLAGAEILGTTSSDVTVTTYSVERYFGEWTALAEYQEMRTDSTGAQSVAGGMMVIPSDSESKAVAWYASLSRRFLQRFEGSVGYARYIGDSSDPKGENLSVPHNAYMYDLQTSLRFDATDSWSFKVELHNMTGTNRLFNEFGQNPDLSKKHWQLWAAKTTFAF